MENSDIKPSTIMLIAGGAVLLISTFLDWYSFSVNTGFGTVSEGFNGWETDGFGLLGIICAAIGVVVGGGVAAQQFGNVSMPDKILDFSHDQIHMVLGFSALLITLGLFFRGDAGIGLYLAILSAGVICAAAFMDMKADDAAPAAPPTQF